MHLHLSPRVPFHEFDESLYKQRCFSDDYKETFNHRFSNRLFKNDQFNNICFLNDWMHLSNEYYVISTYFKTYLNWSVTTLCLFRTDYFNAFSFQVILGLLLLLIRTIYKLLSTKGGCLSHWMDGVCQASSLDFNFFPSFKLHVFLVTCSAWLIFLGLQLLKFELRLNACCVSLLSLLGLE